MNNSYSKQPNEEFSNYYTSTSHAIIFLQTIQRLEILSAVGSKKKSQWSY